MGVARITACGPAATPYEQHRDYVLAVLARRCGWLDLADREAAFHDAYAVMLEKQRTAELDVDAMHARQLRAFLVQTAIHKGLDEGKRAGRKRTVALVDGGLSEPDPGASVEDQVAANLDSLPVREMVGELTKRRQQIIKLRYILDRSPDEIQGLLGITERVYRRELERAVRHLGERYEVVRSGRWCEGRRSLILAYVSGIAGPNRVRDAHSHLAHCPGCARMAAEFRTTLRDAAVPSSPKRSARTHACPAPRPPMPRTPTPNLAPAAPVPLVPLPWRRLPPAESHSAARAA